LFNPYTTDKGEVTSHLKQVKDNSEVDLNILKKIIPESNWDRYFSKIIACENTYLKERLEELYSLRNKVAHNKTLLKVDYQSILRIISEVKPTLEKAIDKLDRIEISDAEKKEITKSIGELNNNYDCIEQIFKNWIDIRNLIYRFALLIKGNDDDSKKNYVNVNDISHF
jgi:hypothetical protein